jgi:hypothetical protein
MKPSRSILVTFGVSCRIPEWFYRPARTAGDKPEPRSDGRPKGFLLKRQPNAEFKDLYGAKHPHLGSPERPVGN